MKLENRFVMMQRAQQLRLFVGGRRAVANSLKVVQTGLKKMRAVVRASM
jgi:hypothetical protein